MEDILIIYGLPILGAIILLLGWYYGLTKGKPKQKKETEKKEAKTLRAFVVNFETHAGDYEDIPIRTAKKMKAKCGSLGQQVTDVENNEITYELLFKDGDYSPMPILVSENELSPRLIGRALAIRDKIALVYLPLMLQVSSGNIKQILWWTGIIAVIVFLVVVD